MMSGRFAKRPFIGILRIERTSSHNNRISYNVLGGLYGIVIYRKAEGKFYKKEYGWDKNKGWERKKKVECGTAESDEACGEDALGGMAVDGVDKQGGREGERSDDGSFGEGLFEKKKQEEQVGVDSVKYIAP